MHRTNDKICPSVLAWLGLLVLTMVSLVLGSRFGHASWMPLLVALIIWVKGTLVARYFIESDTAHPFIAMLLRVFVAFVPVALVLTALLGK